MSPTSSSSSSAPVSKKPAPKSNRRSTSSYKVTSSKKNTKCQHLGNLPAPKNAKKCNLIIISMCSIANIRLFYTIRTPIDSLYKRVRGMLNRMPLSHPWNIPKRNKTCSSSFWTFFPKATTLLNLLHWLHWIKMSWMQLQGSFFLVLSGDKSQKKEKISDEAMSHFVKIIVWRSPFIPKQNWMLLLSMALIISQVALLTIWRPCLRCLNPMELHIL